MKKSGSIIIPAIVGLSVLGFGAYKTSHYLWEDNSAEFFKGIFKNPKNVGAFSPCSKFVAKEITKKVSDCSGDVNILEVGAGTGQFTTKIAKILEELKENQKINSYKLDVVELDPEFCEILTEKFKDNSNITVHCIDISKWQSDYKYDCIISAVPFGNIPNDIVKNILSNYENIMKDGGTLSYVELMFLPQIKRSFTFGESKKLIGEKQSIIDQFREKYLIETVYIWKNITPAYVYHLKIG